MNTQQMGQMEKGIAGKYDFSISGVFKEAWAKVTGLKAPAWGALIVIVVATILLDLVVSGLGSFFKQAHHGAGPTTDMDTMNFIGSLISSIILYPLSIGLCMIAIKRSVDAPIRAMMVFDYYHYFARLTGVFILRGILIAIPFIISVMFFILGGSANNSLLYVILGLFGMVAFLAGIYLSFCYTLFSGQVLVEKNLDIWAALEASRKAVTQHWFKIFFTFILLFIINFIACLPLLIGLIWSIPFTFAVQGVLYRIIFGVESAQLVK
jgi:predicted neutral ceramidase superfamily lipid hydrolase